MKISTGRRSVNDDKFSRRLELVGNLRSVAKKSTRRFRIGFADDLFTGHRHGCAKQTVESQTESETGSAVEVESTPRTGISQTDLAVGLAAIAGLTLGYLIGRRRK